MVAAGDLEARPSELITAAGAAFAWAGLAEEARTVLAIAEVRTLAEKRITAHAMSLVATAVVGFHRAGDDAAHSAARRALDFAATSGLGDYHGIAPAIAIEAATGHADSVAVPEIERAIALARRATTRLGLLLVLILAGDVLLRRGDDRGRAWLEEAERLIGACPDPGITGPMLDRVAARHRITRAPSAPVAGLVEQLSERELAVLRYLPSTLSLPEIARELYVSPNTVKTQCSAVYRKLAVTSRRAAVQVAREQGLL